jgi:RNA polymerase sigma-70 factor (ECF subfamily)
MAGPGRGDRETEDDRLAAAAAAGDRAAFARLAERHAPRLFRLAHALSGQTADAEDLVQDTLLRALAALPRYTPRGRLGAWLDRILVHLATDRRRASRRLLVTDAGELPQRADPDPGPADAAESGERRRQLRLALAALPPPYRLVLAAVYGSGLTVREAARALGLSETAVKNRAFRARQMLRTALETDATREADGVAPTAQPCPEPAAPGGRR